MLPHLPEGQVGGVLHIQVQDARKSLLRIPGSCSRGHHRLRGTSRRVQVPWGVGGTAHTCDKIGGWTHEGAGDAQRRYENVARVILAQPREQVGPKGLRENLDRHIKLAIWAAQRLQQRKGRSSLED